mmetsp:Transcript_7512/g.21436  ORF Transcript_7512/g.21436 Transcript_7512/m.21436 type:complete len:267 (-) Transcript_7512:142-942(-)
MAALDRREGAGEAGGPAGDGHPPLHARRLRLPAGLALQRTPLHGVLLQPRPRSDGRVVLHGFFEVVQQPLGPLRAGAIDDDRDDDDVICSAGNFGARPGARGLAAGLGAFRARQGDSPAGLHLSWQRHRQRHHLRAEHHGHRVRLPLGDCRPRALQAHDLLRLFGHRVAAGRQHAEQPGAGARRRSPRRERCRVHLRRRRHAAAAPRLARALRGPHGSELHHHGRRLRHRRHLPPLLDAALRRFKPCRCGQKLLFDRSSIRCRCRE